MLTQIHLRKIGPGEVFKPACHVWKTLSIAFAVAVLTLTASSGFAQGTIAFQNTASTLVTTFFPFEEIAPVTSTSGIYIELLYQPNSGGAAPAAPTYLQDLGSWEPAMANAGVIGPIPGRFGAYSVTTGTDVAPAGNVWLTSILWNGGYTTLSAAQNGYPSLFEWSNVWSQGTGNGGSISPVSTTAYFQGMEFPPIPEPSATTLGCFGALLCLLLRRLTKRA